MPLSGTSSVPLPAATGRPSAVNSRVANSRRPAFWLATRSASTARIRA